MRARRESRASFRKTVTITYRRATPNHAISQHELTTYLAYMSVDNSSVINTQKMINKARDSMELQQEKHSALAFFNDSLYDMLSLNPPYASHAKRGESKTWKGHAIAVTHQERQKLHKTF